MGNLTTTDYVEGAAALGLFYWGLKHETGWKKYALLAIGAYLAYGVYQDYSGATTST